jgi:hypothetical protein
MDSERTTLSQRSGQQKSLLPPYFPTSLPHPYSLLPYFTSPALLPTSLLHFPIPNPYFASPALLPTSLLPYLASPALPLLHYPIALFCPTSLVGEGKLHCMDSERTTLSQRSGQQKIPTPYYPTSLPQPYFPTSLPHPYSLLRFPSPIPYFPISLLHYPSPALLPYFALLP